MISFSYSVQDHTNIQDSSTQSTPDFIYTNSLSKASQQLQSDDKKGRIYMILHNPILGTLLSYKRHALSNNKRIILENLNNNTLIKSILFQNGDYEVAKTDYDISQEFLDNFVVYDIFQKYHNILNTLFSEFDFSPVSSHSDSYQKDCVEQMFHMKVDYIKRMYSKHIMDSSSSDGSIFINEDVLDALHDYNEYDNMLYTNALQKAYSDVLE